MTPRALLLDYAGVLTGPIGASFQSFEEAHGIPPGRCFSLLLDREPTGGLIVGIERGEVSVASFDAALRRCLVDDGHAPPAGSLVGGLFAGLRPRGELWDLAVRARTAGVATAVVSNSWGTDTYPRDRLDATFDTVVISAEVGLRKPDPAVFEHACGRLGVAPAECVFVDDLPANVAAASALGMAGVHHSGDDASTTSIVTRLLGLPPTPVG